MLEDEPHLRPYSPKDVWRRAGDGLAVHCDLAGSRQDQAIDTAQERRLSGAAGADECYKLSSAHLEIDTVEGHGSARVALGQPSKPYHPRRPAVK